MEKKFKRTLVTCALPYANGPVHIGHLAGVYVPADIYVRYLRMRGEDVLYICGSDEHGVPITIKARKEGCTPQDIVDRYHKVIRDSFTGLGINFDIYGRTSSEVHEKNASEFFRKLYDEGKFITKESEQYYDPEARQFLADRYIVGTCPKCGNPDAYGDQCEKCGSTLSPEELINPKSKLSGAEPVKKKTTHWYLPLDQYEPWLRDWILEQHKEWRSTVYGQCKSWIDGGLQPRAVSRDLDWGVPVPVEGAEGKVLYVWFDAPIGYISNTQELLPQSWEKWWKSEDTRLVHFIGKDNIVFHCIVFPSMLKAYGDGYILPDNVPANEFLNLEGDKISTSKNWAVWAHEYLRDFPGKQDVIRYVLQICADLAIAFEPFTPFAAEKLRRMLGVCLCAGIDHRKGEQVSANTYKDGECAALHTVSAAAPSPEDRANCPGAGKSVCLGWDVLGQEELLPVGHEIGAAELLFAKIEDEAIDAQLARLEAIRAEREAAEKAEAAKKVAPQKAECSFGDFEKMDIRTATVLAAERVPKTDKLLKLSIDTGIDKRTIVSGIAEYYSPEEMVGRQICILANLQPRTIRGIESRGMILMARQGDGKMRFITPAEALVNGAEIG